MRISCIEVSNFRKLLAIRVDCAEETTVFVGSNNSGKTSAMVALRFFLAGAGTMRTHDLTLTHWTAINRFGEAWESSNPSEDAPHDVELALWRPLMPSLDLWLEVQPDEFHHVSKIIPRLDWAGGELGVRRQWQPAKIDDLRRAYLKARLEARNTLSTLSKNKEGAPPLDLWPRDLIHFLERQAHKHFEVATYSLDPQKREPPNADGIAKPQALTPDASPLAGNPLDGLVRVNEIWAQRSFGDPHDNGAEGESPRRNARRLSSELQQYYRAHLDPTEQPGPEDLEALQAIDAARAAFDDRLNDSFQPAFQQVQRLGYPGLMDPRLRVATSLRLPDSLDHDSAVTFDLDVSAPDGTTPPTLSIPESSNGLGYQNLISIVFRLMGFRDRWMRVGKVGKRVETDAPLEPIHLVLVEEPEAHLHAQVQQVFIRKAYDVLRHHPELGVSTRLRTQMIVSTHSSHVAHEVDFSSLRYFRRLPAGMSSTVPVSSVVNLSMIFGVSTDSFVARYLKAQHADLFFADAAILVEGTAERMLLPHFIRLHYQTLNSCYITILDIGGSHARQLEPLLTHLGLLTLVITDIDAVNEQGHATQPRRGQNQRSSNPTLKQWLPRLDTIDELLSAGEQNKTAISDQLFSIRVAYQTPSTVPLLDGSRVETLAGTFEDALAFANLRFFSQMKGTGLVTKFSDAIAAHSADTAELGEAFFDALREGRKADLVMQILADENLGTLTIPTYIDEGLVWLEGRLTKRQLNSVLSEKVTGA